MKESGYIEGKVEMEYSRAPGKVRGKFFTELRDNGELVGVRCSKCSHVFIPPQSYCPDCRVKMQSFVPIPIESGRVENFTVVHEKIPFSDWQPPFAYVAIKFDGANTTLWHRMKDTNIEEGTAVRPVFKQEDERAGGILDIDYFEKA